MKFKRGDIVMVLDGITTNGWTSKVGEISADRLFFNRVPVVFNNCAEKYFKEEDLELVTEEETSMKFKVGDKVKVSNSWEGRSGEVGEITRRNIWEAYPFRVTFEDGAYESFKGSDLIVLSTEEEKVMKFKVGDKVKVKDSWFGFTGEVGLIVRIDDSGNYPYRVKFDVVDEKDEEIFAEGSLELVKEKAKQSFTKSDLKTGMGVVLRNGRQGHILVDTGCVDVIRFLENGNYSRLKDFSDDLISNYRKENDIMEVYSTEYQYKLLTDMVFEAKCVFKREEPTKMTMKEINEHFGKAIEIIE